MFQSLNPCIDFHQIVRIHLPQEDLELIRLGGGGGGGGGRYLATTVAMEMLKDIWVFKFVGVYSLNPCMAFRQIFRITLPKVYEMPFVCACMGACCGALYLPYNCF